MLKKFLGKGVPSSLPLRRDKGGSQLVTAASYNEADVSAFHQKVFFPSPTPQTLFTDLCREERQNKKRSFSKVFGKNLPIKKMSPDKGSAKAAFSGRGQRC